MSALSSVFYFIIAIGILVTIHEYGHFWVARRVGVKVLRFSVGFGRPILRWQKTPEDTEYVLAMIPLGGYVKMVDEREGEVSEKDLPQAFNRQSLAGRTAIVAAGPVFNFLFAIIAYWLIFVIGIPGVKPLMGEVPVKTEAALAGFQADDEIVSVAGREIKTWRQLQMTFFSEMAGGSSEIEVEVINAKHERLIRRLDVSQYSGLLEKPDALSILGFKQKEFVPDAKFGQISPGEAAAAAGFKKGDRILTVMGKPVDSWAALVALIRENADQRLEVTYERQGVVQEAYLRPRLKQLGEQAIGYIGAAPYIPAEWFSKVQYPMGEALLMALIKTWDMSAISLKMMGKMIVGDVSVKNLSGPISIAQFAGKSAERGFVEYVGFLAFISLSLGVLNLLPVPVLDGGHLLFFAIEFIKGSPLSENAQLIGLKVGFTALMCLIVITFYNDILRVFS